MFGLVTALDTHTELLGPSLADWPESAQASYEALLEIGMEIQAQEPRLGAVFDLVVRRARELVGSDLAWIALLEGDVLQMSVADGARAEAFIGMAALPRHLGIGGVTINDMRPVFVPDYAAFEHTTEERVKAAVLAEGLVSSLSVPMSCKGRLIGVLHVAQRTPRTYTEAQTALLSALANQASVAIVNAQLYATLNERNRALERAFEIHRELTAAGLAGVGLEGIGRRVVALIGSPLVLDQDVAVPERMSWAPEGQEQPDADAQGLELPLLDEEDLGTLRLPGVAVLDTMGRMALEQGRIVIALELSKLRVARDVEWRLRGELLGELLEHEGEPPERLVHRAHLLGIDLTSPHRVFVVQADRSDDEDGKLLTAVRTSLAARQWLSLSVKRGASVVVALQGDEESGDQVETTILGAGRRAGATCSVGVSAPQRVISVAYREALACLRLAREAGGGRTLRFERVGALRFLLDVADPQHAIALVREELGAFMLHDRTARVPLLPTVRAYVEADGHHPTVAARCYIHISTLKYRITRINALLEQPLSTPDTRFRLRLAFEVLNLLHALGIAVEPTPHDESSPAGEP
jgi:DNA-binding PucR family transcriptional regulator